MIERIVTIIAFLPLSLVLIAVGNFLIVGWQLVHEDD